MSLSSFLVGALLFTSSSLLHLSHALPAPLAQSEDSGPVEESGSGELSVNATVPVVSANNTLNATTPAGSSSAPALDAAADLSLAFVNYLDSTDVYAYVTGLDATGQLVFLGPSGDFFFPNTTASTPQNISQSDIAIPLGGPQSTTTATIPGYLSSGRIYFSVGELEFFVVAIENGVGLVEPSAVSPSDPSADVNWGFAELTWADGYGLYADISFVDFVGLPLGIELTVTDDSGTQSALGLVSTAVTDVCNALKAQAAIDGAPWGEECIYTSDNELIRVLAPQDVLTGSNDYWSTYFDAYIQEVFEAYSTTPLQIDTQTDAGVVNCTADTTTMNITCAGDNRPYAAPSAGDIFGCNSGPFALEADDNGIHYAIVPRLCAAFNRGTFMVDGGNLQPNCSPDLYYTSTSGIYNYFSKFTHQYESDNHGYAFSYDDVAAEDSENVSGSVVSASPGTLTVFVGGYDLA